MTATYGYAPEFIDLVVFLVKKHSKKKLLDEKDTPLELVILMEADMLDEIGALSILWDSMAEGAQEKQSFEQTYRHIAFYYDLAFCANPMATEKAKMFWEQKKNLMREFIEQLKFDLGL